MNIFKRLFHSRIHLDYASTTPVSPEVLRVMQRYWSAEWANPSALYEEGVRVRRVIEEARVRLARTLHVRPHDITFTSGGTESNNLALVGIVEALSAQGRNYTDMEIISTKLEHPSILETLAYLKGKGVQVTFVPVTADGLIQGNELEKFINERTVLVTCAYANSEIGVIQDVKAITRTVKRINAERKMSVRVHVDGSQAPLWLPCELDMLGVDLLTLDAGKCYGPKGVGVLARRHGVALYPILHGGGQERGLRSGTENTALIAGCVEAIVRAQKEQKKNAETIARVRDHGFALIHQEIPDAIINGSTSSRIANNINISIPGLDTEYAVIWLDRKGIAASTKSACGVHGADGSSVVREMTGDETRVRSTIRFTLGKESRENDIARAVAVLKEHIAFAKLTKLH